MSLLLQGSLDLSLSLHTARFLGFVLVLTCLTGFQLLCIPR